MLHVVLLAYYPFHRLAVVIERAVEVTVIDERIGRLLDLGIELVDTTLLTDSAYQRVLIEKQHYRQHYQRRQQRKRQITSTPVNKFIHITANLLKIPQSPANFRPI